jgi:hypothetical protein
MLQKSSLHAIHVALDLCDAADAAQCIIRFERIDISDLSGHEVPDSAFINKCPNAVFVHVRLEAVQDDCLVRSHTVLLVSSRRFIIISRPLVGPRNALFVNYAPIRSTSRGGPRPGIVPI